jgi:hypothetical protein
MLDIIFISCGEPGSEQNFQKLKRRFSWVKRVQNAPSISAAHFEAAKLSITKFFYVVDADADVVDSFNFDYKPDMYDSQYVHVWNAMNPSTGYDYGYGGVKLFNKDFFKGLERQGLDFTMSVAPLKLHGEISCYTRFNTGYLESFRSAFRESVKLYQSMHSVDTPVEERDDAKYRLHSWLNPNGKSQFSNQVAGGASAGLLYSAKGENLDAINDRAFFPSWFTTIFPEVDLDTSPFDVANSPMKNELFFTTRIAGALYDEFVLKNLPLTEVRDAISDGQLFSKHWLTTQLVKLREDGVIQDGMKTLIIGGWIGTLSLMFNSWELKLEVTSIDTDERANTIAEKLNYDFPGFRTSTEDAYEIDYSQYDLIINTISEHLPSNEKWRDLIPPGKLVVAQSNNYLEGEGHVSTVESSGELRADLRLSEVLYEGMKTFQQYDRFMIIGRT